MGLIKRFVYGNKLDKEGYTILKDNQEIPQDVKTEIIKTCEAFGEYYDFENKKIGYEVGILCKPIKSFYTIIQVKYIGKDEKGRDGALKFSSIVFNKKILERVDYNPFTLLRWNKEIFENEQDNLVFMKMNNKFLYKMSNEIVVNNTTEESDPEFKKYIIPVENILKGKKTFLNKKVNFEYLIALLPFDKRKKISIATYLEHKNNFFDLSYVRNSLDSFQGNIGEYGRKLHSFMLKCKNSKGLNCLKEYNNIINNVTPNPSRTGPPKSRKKVLYKPIRKKSIALIVVIVFVIAIITTFSIFNMTRKVNPQKIIVLREYKNLVNGGNLDDLQDTIKDFKNYKAQHEKDSNIEDRLTKLEKLENLYEKYKEDYKKMLKEDRIENMDNQISEISIIEKYGNFKNIEEDKKNLNEKKKLYERILSDFYPSLSNKIKDIDKKIKEIERNDYKKSIENTLNLYKYLFGKSNVNYKNIQESLSEIKNYKSHANTLNIEQIYNILKEKEKEINDLKKNYSSIKNLLDGTINKINKFKENFFLPKKLKEIKSQIEEIERNYKKLVSEEKNG